MRRWAHSLTRMEEWMDLLDVIRARRSIKAFLSRPVPREELERLLEVAVHAPNHRMTQPWRFYVLGPRARRAYGEAVGGRKARKVEDPDAAEALVSKLAASHEALPAMLAVSMILDEDPRVREEDYAATFMAIQNLCLLAYADGLGTHIKTGGVMDDPRAREAVGVAEDERIVATIELGVPADVPDPKVRRPAKDLTTWLD
jgi:nitroreductase